MKPFLKWAGNKYQIIERIKGILPEGKRLIEPFVGSGAVFLNTEFPRYLLSDNNQDLIILYQYLQEEGKKFIDYCSRFFKRKIIQKKFFINLGKNLI
jgi:DNA adenine methylase